MSTTQPERPTCATCPYWYRYGNDDLGQCRRRPPRIVAKILEPREGDCIPGVEESWDATKFPATAFDEWCGEHPDFPAWIAATRKTKT